MPLYFWLVIGNVGGFFSVVMCLVEIVVFFYVGGVITCRRYGFMKESAPSWDGGDSGIQDNDFQCKYLMEAFRTIFKNPALLKSNADGA
jgi:hypothetical protein